MYCPYCGKPLVKIGFHRFVCEETDGYLTLVVHKDEVPNVSR